MLVNTLKNLDYAYLLSVDFIMTRSGDELID